MLIPAAIYLMVQWDGPGRSGWGIPMATDIAFVVGFLALLGSRVPFGLKILLLTLAIVDDIGAILVIAVAYTAHTSLTFLIIGIASFGIIYLFRWIGVRLVPVYVGLGAGIWYLFLKSGVHPTVAGVVLGLLTPARPWFVGQSLVNVAAGVVSHFGQESDPDNQEPHEAAHLLTITARESISPLDRLETALHSWVAFGIMPLFALANAGVRVELSAMSEPVALAVALGRIVGKPLGASPSVGWP